MAALIQDMRDTAAKVSYSPFLGLPRELRDMVYKFALVEDQTIRYSCFRRLSPKPTALALFQVSRQAYAESIPNFYRCNTFHFWEPQTAVLLLSVSPDAIKNIHHVHLDLRQSQLKGSSAGLEDNLCRALEFFCLMLATRSQLHSLTIKISQVDGKDEFTARHFEKGHYKIRDVPVWANHLATLKGLQHLNMRWYCSEFRYFGTMLATLKLMHADMLENGVTMSDSQGMRVRIRHQRDDFENTVQYKLIELDMEIDMDEQSAMCHKRRSKIHPHVWCLNCGLFGAQPYCRCGIPFTHDNPCDHCGDSTDQKLCRCGKLLLSSVFRGNKDTSRAAIQLHPHETVTFPLEDHVWNSKRWGDKPLDHYLPYDITREDFSNALAYLNTGYKLKLATTWEDDYTDSDFGDTDGLLTIDDRCLDDEELAKEDDSDDPE